VKAPGGCSLADLWSTVAEGRSVCAPVDGLDDSKLPVALACEVQGFDASDYVGARAARRLDRAVQLAVGAGLDAVEDAGRPHVEAARCGVVTGTAFGGMLTLIRQLHTCLFESCERVSPLGIPKIMVNAPAANLAMLLGWTGPNMGICTAHAAGSHAIGEAARLIREGDADIVLAGGTESCIAPFILASLWRMGVLSERNDTPSAACRPFDVTRDGSVLGEGAGFLLLEDWQRAESRGVRIHAEIAGYGRNCDAAHLTSPAPSGAGAAACMELALGDSRTNSADVGHINAHGTGTVLNDQREAEAIVKVFGSSPPPLTAPKGTIGHLLGAAGAVEAIITILTMQHRLVPPTANFLDGGPGMPLDVVSREPRPLSRTIALSNSFGFGGHNSSLVFKLPNHPLE
jgi:3-oxoacyl-[acyl-carrier-protein] synthase II